MRRHSLTALLVLLATLLGARRVGAQTCASPIVIAAGGGTVTGTTGTGTSALFGSCSAGATNATAENVYRWTPNVSGIATISTCGAGTTFDTVLYIRTVCTGSDAPLCFGGTNPCCNDDACNNASGVYRASKLTPTVTAGTPYYIVVDGFYMHGPYALTVTPPVAVTTTTTTTVTTTSGPTTSSTTSTSTSSTSSTSTSSTTTTSSSTSSTTTTTLAGGACGNATTIPAAGGTFTGTTSGSSTLSGTCGSSAFAPEQVFAWTPNLSGLAHADTCGVGTTYDSVLYVRGSPCASGTQIACQDDGCANVSGANIASGPLGFTVTAGQTYYLVVDGFGGAHGAFVLHVSPPSGATTTTTSSTTSTSTSSTTTTSTSSTTVTTTSTTGVGTTTSTTSTTSTSSTTTTSTSTSTSSTTTLPSACNSPIIIASAGGTFSGTTSGASTLAGSCGGGMGPEKVYQWTPALSGQAILQTCGAGTNYDTVLYMRSGSCLGGAEITGGCNDDACTNSLGSAVASKVTPTVTAGTTYYVVVDGKSGGGAYTLTVTPPSVTTTTTTTLAGGATTTTTLNQPMTWSWNRAFVGASGFSDSVVQGVAIDGSGNVAAVGKYEGTVDFGTGNKTTAGFYDVFVAKYGSTGTPLWVKSYGEANDNEEAKGVAFDPSGNVVVTGVFRQTVNFGDGNLAAAGTYLGDVFLAKYDGTTGNAISGQTKRFGSTGHDQGFAVAVDVSGNVFMMGQYNGTVDFGNGTPLVSAGGSNMFVAKYDSSLACLWARSLNTYGTPAGQLGVDANGNVYIAGGYTGTIDLSPGGVFTSQGGGDVFVAKLDPAGVVLWARTPTGGTGEDNVAGITVEGSNVFIVGGYAGGLAVGPSIDFGAGAISSNGDIFLAKYNTAGTIQWAKGFGGRSAAQLTTISQVAADAAGFATVVASPLETTSWGGDGPLEFAGSNGYDIGLARFSGAGTNSWHVRPGGLRNDFGLAIASNASLGTIVAGGSYLTTTLNFGGGVLPAPPNATSPNGFLVVYAP